MTSRTLALALILLALFPPVLLRAAERQAVFGAGVEMVNLSVTVTDKSKRFVGSLTREDFQILEDGVPQEVRFFERGTLPLSLVVMIDGSTSMTAKLREVQTAAGRFVQTLRPGDRAQVVEFAGQSRVLQDFTSDIPSLQAAIGATRADGATALYTALYVAMKAVAVERPGTPLCRRAVIVLSDGADTSSAVTDDQVLELARRSGVTVYAIKLNSPEADALSQTLLNPGLSAYFFAALARETGGEVRSVEAASQLDGVYLRVAEELHSQYSLGYVPSNRARDGRWRQVMVELREPALNVRHRVGYFASGK